VGTTKRSGWSAIGFGEGEGRAHKETVPGPSELNVTHAIPVQSPCAGIPTTYAFHSPGPEITARASITPRLHAV